jgi:outer membrane protein OmpA-like peptidoglycan-associated protein
MWFKTTGYLALTIFTLILCSCFHPPYNNFQPDHRTLRSVTTNAGIGAGAGALIGSVAAGNTAAGAVIGGATGAAIGLYKHNHQSLLKELQAQNIMYIQYGDTMTLVIPTDRYFLFNSSELNDVCYPGLNNIAKFLQDYPQSTVYVAGFTDNVGSRHHKKRLSQAQAETMLTFLWANGIKAQLLHAEGYADQHDVGDNKWIHGSAYNRRIEIQWLNGVDQSKQLAPYIGGMK